MKFEELPLKGAYLLSIEPRGDERGFFARAYCAREFSEHGLIPSFVQANMSECRRAGTIRGMHYQIAPAPEAKYIRCIRGAIYDVMVDLRPLSPTYGQHVGVELSEDDHLALYVPEMFAHGYQALTDDAMVYYQVSEFYTPACERGLRYDDPALGIRWPLPATAVSDKDLRWPAFNPRVARLVAGPEPGQA